MKKSYSTLIQSGLFFKKGFMRFGVVFLMMMFFVAEESVGQTLYTWNQTGTASWAVATNWTPDRITPAVGDSLIFSNGATTTVTNVPTQTIGQLSVSGNTTVNLQPAATGNILTIAGLTGSDDLTVAAGSALNIDDPANALTIFVGAGATGVISGNMTFSVADHRLDAAAASGIVFNSPAIFTQSTGCTGPVFTNAGAAGAIIFGTGTTFISAAGASPFGLPLPSSKVIFQTGSLFKMAQNTTPEFSGRTYANLEINFPTFSQSVTGAGLFTVDNLTITLGVLNLNLTTAGVNIKGNLSVAAGQTLTFTPASASTLVLNGTTPQSITNNGTLTFGANAAVTFNNAAGITLNNDITLNSLVTFTSGIITNPSALLVFSATATVASASNNSFVNNSVRKVGNTAFVFPVGRTNCGISGTTNGYAPISISNFQGTVLPTDQFTAAYLRDDATLIPISAAGLDHVSRCDYWLLVRSAGTSTVDITLSWDNTINNCTSLAQYINDLGALTIAHSGLLTSNWDNYATVGTWTGTNAAGTITWAGTQSGTFGAFTLGSINFNNPLPINLNYLNGFKQNGNHNLTWKITCTNNPSATMSLERSADGRNYKGITTITADAVRCLQPFDYTDNSPLAGMNYYRLKMTDAYGKVTYTTAIALLNKESGFDIVGLSPTLVSSNAVLNVTAAQKTKMNVLVTDIAGKQVQKIACNLIAGSNQFTLNFASLSAGTYQITGYTADAASRTVRFVKQ